MSDKVKIYFKGCSGIEKPVDVDGKEIVAGSILTFDWFEKVDYERSHEPSEEEKQKPFYRVKKHESGKGLFAESIQVNKTLRSRFYLHDFRFKFTKRIS
jgi:hypothetical protein